MSIVTIPAAIVAVAALSTQVQKAEDPPPPQIASADVPFVYVRAGPARHELVREGEDYRRVEREYYVRCATTAKATGTPSQRETIGRAVLADLIATLVKYPKLNATVGVVRADVERDTGIVELPDFDNKWVGFEIRMRVVEQLARTYAAGE
jgi:hypothetical protein